MAEERMLILNDREVIEAEFPTEPLGLFVPDGQDSLQVLRVPNPKAWLDGKLRAAGFDLDWIIHVERQSVLHRTVYRQPIQGALTGKED